MSRGVNILRLQGNDIVFITTKTSIICKCKDEVNKTKQKIKLVILIRAIASDGKNITKRLIESSQARSFHVSDK